MAKYRVTLMADEVECVIAVNVEAADKESAAHKAIEDTFAEGKMCVSEHWRVDVHLVN